jgi:site-specific DNA-methyltransferase (cytosine-N4-specific)
MMHEFARGLQVYGTRRGVQLCADSRVVLRTLPADSVDLIVTSPPFALLRQKSYGNESQSEYVVWLGEFGEAAFRVLKPTGSFVLDLGGAYERGRPVRSLYNFRVLLDWCDRIGYRLAEEFFWYNPAKLPSPIEWVNKRKLRAKDAVNTVWWFSKTDQPKADVTKVLVPYSGRMETLLKDPGKFYTPKGRPSGHDIAKSFGKRNAGAIPSNLLQIPNTDSNSHYLRTCKMLGRESHPARYPGDLPRFFINFLTGPDDLVVDIFSGSNTTGRVAEESGRRWISIEVDRQFSVLSAVRFMTTWDDQSIQTAVKDLDSGRVIDLEAGLSLGLTTEVPRPVGSLQNQLFE